MRKTGYPWREALARCLLVVLFIGLAAAAEGEQADAPAAPSDPALHLVSDRLSPEDEKSCRKLFEQIGSADFDVRQQALNGLVAKGSAVFPWAEEFAKHHDPEVSAQAKGLKQKVLLDYDGYLRTDPALKAALRKTTIDLAADSVSIAQFKETAANAGIMLVLDSTITLPERLWGRSGGGAKFSIESFVQCFMQHDGIAGVPRGNVFVLTTLDKARALATQRHTFDWSGLGLNRDEAERAVKTLQSFFPPVSTELHAGSEVLVVRGEEEAIARAARLIALLQPGAPDAIWPVPPLFAGGDKSPGRRDAGGTLPPPLAGGGRGRAKAADLLLKELSAPATLVLSAEDPLDAILQLKQQQHEIFVVTNDDGDVSQSPPFPKDVSGMSPLRLSLHNQPLGLMLRWLERRGKFPAGQQADLVLSYEVGPAGRLQFRVRPKAPRVLDLCVAGADVGFVYRAAARPGADSDAAARTRLLEVLAPHWALFPACDADRDFAVSRGRLLLQGQYATLARALELVGEWRSRGESAPPPPAEWKKALDARLDAPIAWDGRGKGGGNLLSTLRRLGSVDILLEDAPDGSAPQFELTARDAQLLPPGKYPLKALLDDLARKTGALWRIELGAIVLTPKAGER